MSLRTAESNVYNLVQNIDPCDKLSFEEILGSSPVIFDPGMHRFTKKLMKYLGHKTDIDS